MAYPAAPTAYYPQTMPPKGGFAVPGGMPQRGPRPSMMTPSPGTQPLAVPPGLGMDPAQMAALQSQMSPEMMQQVSQMMQDPQVQAQLQQLEQMAKNGQLTPEVLAQAMGGLPMPEGASLLGDFNPVQWIRNGLIGVGMGLVTGSLLDRFMEGAASDKPSALEWCLKQLEAIPGVASLNNWLNGKLKAASALSAGKESTWLRLDGHYTADQVMKNYYQTYLAKNGHLYPELAKMQLSPSVFRQLTQKTHNAAQLSRLLKPELKYFLPEAVQDLAMQELHGSGPLVSIQSTLSKWLPKGWVTPPKPSHVTLRQLDRLVDQQHLVQWLHESVEKKVLSGNTATQVLEALEKTVAQPGVHAGDAFASRLTRLVNQAPAGKTLKKLLGLPTSGGTLTYDAIQTALKAKTGGRQPVWKALQDATKGLLSKDLVNVEKMTIAQAQRHINQFHITEQLAKVRPQAAQNLRSTMSGLLGRTQFMDTNYRAVMEGEHALARALEKKGVGPVGRFFGKIGYYLQRTLDGANLRRISGKTVSSSGSLFGRAMISLFIFGLAVGAFNKDTVQEDETPTLPGQPQPNGSQKPSLYLKTARFLDVLASGVGGYMGYELGRSFIPQLKVLTRLPWLANLCNRSVFGLFTIGGFLSELLIPGVVGFLVGWPVQKAVNLIFGDPKHIAQREQFEADKQRQLKSQRGILEGFAKGEMPKIPGIVPGIEAIAPDKTALTPQNVGLTPEQIAQNPIATAQAKQIAHAFGHREKTDQEAFWTYGAH